MTNAPAVSGTYKKTFSSKLPLDFITAEIKKRTSGVKI